MSIDNSNSIKVSGMGISKKDIDPAGEKGEKTKDIKGSNHKFEGNGIKCLLKIDKQANFGIIVFLCMVKNIISSAGYFTDISFLDISLLM